MREIIKRRIDGKRKKDEESIENCDKEEQAR